MNQLHGRIDISFGVKGTKGKGVMRFKSVRKTRMGFVSRSSIRKSNVNGNAHSMMQFETQEWSLEMEDGRKLQLLDETRDDPFKHTALQAQSQEDLI